MNNSGNAKQEHKKEKQNIDDKIQKKTESYWRKKEAFNQIMQRKMGNPFMQY